ncbi:unnamed protein product [Durusdinium trenchii]|uniref:Inosine/uridine-preferring nucleoside hydrolase domain-containing protein n=1 Tax=Durusdinium trenchii TaxID=1381693 RepID=A0ABP0HFK0_9DINO
MAALVMLTTSPQVRLRLVTTVHGVCAAPVAAPLAQRLLLGLGVSALVVPGATRPSFGAEVPAELPGWVEKFREVVGKIIMAGDNTKANPFNFRLDPVALDVVLNSGVIQMVGTCCRPDAKE